MWRGGPVREEGSTRGPNNGIDCLEEGVETKIKRGLISKEDAIDSQAIGRGDSTGLLLRKRKGKYSKGKV